MHRLRKYSIPSRTLNEAWDYNKHITEKRNRKISKTLKGNIPWNKGKKGLQKHTEKEKQRRSGTMKGKNNPSWDKRGVEAFNWIDGRSFLPYPIEFNRQLKELIRNRDNYQCQRCGMPECENIEKLSIHHIDYNKENCLPSNLISLCRRCNGEVNSNREEWIEYFIEKVGDFYEII